MVFVLDTAIGLGVWLPFTIGKSTALLSVRYPFFADLCSAHSILSISWILIVSYKSYTYLFVQCG